MNNVDSLSPAFAQRPSTHRSHRDQLPKAEQTAQARQESVEHDNDADDQGKANGVLRLIQEDHFKGVADVRLRINFYEQLAALKDANQQAATQDAVSELANAVSEIVTQQGALPEDVSVAIGDFQNTLSDLANAQDGGKTLTEDVSNAFSDLATSLRDMLGLNEPATPAESDTESTESTNVLSTTDETGNTSAQQTDNQAPAFDGAAFVTALESAFADFQTGLPTDTQTHEFTPPHGNGSAFDKFVSMYRDLAYSGEQTQTDDAANSVDQQV